MRVKLTFKVLLGFETVTVNVSLHDQITRSQEKSLARNRHHGVELEF